MILKQIPEDFSVEEIPLQTVEEKGKFCVCILKKKNYNTEDAVFEVSRQLKIPRKFISYAGTKDKIAITSQYISILCAPVAIKNFEHKDIFLEFVGLSSEPISLGRLRGNKFVIVVRGLVGDEKITPKKFVNYFHTQRFSNNNVAVGKFLVKKDYRSAVNILLNDSSWSPRIKIHLDKSVNDFVGALKTLPKKILTFYVHAYQSELWNRAVKELLVKKKLIDVVPIPGFSGFDADPITKSVLNNIMVEEGIVLSDFLNKDIPYLCIEGTSRAVFCNVTNLIIGLFLDDELNPGFKKVVLEFELGKGEYATNVVEQLFS